MQAGARSLSALGPAMQFVYMAIELMPSAELVSPAGRCIQILRSDGERHRAQHSVFEAFGLGRSWELV